ncbi:hypothetical protein [Mycobacteroides abscessus]|uniref:hypothetical protein n=1 Tax=Mycobacteroides abscessus TaxID=36809 RepID=UPI0019D2C245|nr:hypothetical protein [Mycobacteroides abscessus]MBN7411166.1 hypothetical protein [Mycobacteroides abscessus subsp. abscessus]
MTSTPLVPPYSQELTLSPFQRVAANAKEQFDTHAAAIRDNPRLNTIAKQEALNELRERTRGIIKDAEAQHRAAREKRITNLQQKLFGRSANERSDPTLAISYRDAAQRAAEVAEGGKDVPKKTLALMDWALQSGDIPLQKALLRIAFDWRLEDVVDAFIARSPSQKEAANELWDLTGTAGSGDVADLVFGVGRDLQTDPVALMRSSEPTTGQSVPYHQEKRTGSVFP